MYCPNCGAAVTETMKFCPYCGSALNTSETALTNVVSTVNTQVLSNKQTGIYTLVLLSCGTCEKSIVIDLLEDIFGYSTAEAKKLVSLAPVEIARKLTEDEAAYIAQMFTEYGIQMTVTDGSDNYVDLSAKAVRSVFNDDGSLVKNVLAVIGGLSLINRVTNYRRVKKPSLLSRLFRTLFTPKRPTHYRRFTPEPPHAPRMNPRPSYYRNSGEHVLRTDTGHRGGPNGRMSTAKPVGKPYSFSASKPSGHKPSGGSGGPKHPGGNKPGRK